MKSSLHAAFIGIWLLVVATCVATGFLMLGLYHLGIDARVDTVAARVDKAAASLRTRFGVYAQSYATPPDFTDAQRRRELGLILQIVLQDYDDVEGGIYSPKAGFVAYAFPSYEGSSTKQDVPEAESSRIAALAERVASSGRAETMRSPGARQTLILASVPAPVAGDSLAIWVMSRAHVRADDGSTRLQLGLALLGFFVVVSGLALLLTIRRWNVALARLGREIVEAPEDAAWQLPPTGHRDLDRVAAMMSTLHRRLADQGAAARRLEGELARAQRVATVGRMAAQLVHEIRNPIAAMRLRAENALAGASAPTVALDHILKDVHRLDDLLERMQAMTRLNALRTRPVAIDRWLAELVGTWQEIARTKRATIAHEAPDAEWPIDADQLARAIGNLVVNAIQHVAPEVGRVVVRVAVEPRVVCRIAIEDNGTGIAERDLGQIFDPFHTTRVDGTGLGLSIAREIVEAHGGTLRALPRADGATFLIELPWPAS